MKAKAYKVGGHSDEASFEKLLHAWLNLVSEEEGIISIIGKMSDQNGIL